MNFLAHLWLADQAALPLPGAVLGDLVRGPVDERFPPDLALSIRLHRRIDVLTDRHALVTQARAQFPDGARRYAGVLLDVMLDHCLALDWSRHAAEPLPEFARRAAREVEAGGAWFVLHGRQVPARGPFEKLLLSYAHPAGIDLALQRIAQRLRRPEGLLAAAAAWRVRLPQLQADAPAVFEEIAQAARAFARSGGA